MDEHWVRSHTIHQILGGSHLYGTNRLDSDEDVRGVCLMPTNVLLGLGRFEQWLKNDGEQDIEIYGLTKFVRMALECNPNILDILFAPRDNWHLLSTQWQQLYAIRHSFLSSKARRTFSGYAAQQMKSMVAHRRWLLEPPEQPQPERYGCWIVSEPNGGQRIMYEFKDEKDEYEAAKLDYDNHRVWITNRNPKRLETEMRCGYDIKNGAHLLRLAFQGVNILEDCDYNPVLHGNELARVKQVLAGDMPYEDLCSMAKELDGMVLNMHTSLPGVPDYNKVEEVLMDINRKSLEY